MRCVYRFTDNVQVFSLQAGSAAAFFIRHPYHDLKGRQQAQKTLHSCGQRRSPNTVGATTVLRIPSYA